MLTVAQFRALLFAQWKHQRAELALLAIGAALIAPLSIWSAVSAYQGAMPALLRASYTFAGFGGTLAVLTGLVLALRPFWLDGRTGHAYALTLPVTRAQYTLGRALTGALLIAIPTLALLTGALLAVAAAPSTSLQAYPVGIAARFVLASLTAFMFAFGVQYGLGRAATRWVLLATATILAFEVAGQVTLHVSLTEPFWQLFAHPWSPFRVFLTPWMLFDV